MAINSNIQAALSESTLFRQQLKPAIIQKARDIMYQFGGEGQTYASLQENEKKMVDLARQIITNSDAWLKPFAESMVADPAITVDYTLADLNNYASVAFPYVAGLIRGEWL